MRTVYLYGSSDDLIEIESSDKKLEEEFYAKSEGASHVAFSDGTVVSIEYGKGGNWHISKIKDGTSRATFDSPDGNDFCDYSDLLILEGDITWAVCGEMVSVKN